MDGALKVCREFNSLAQSGAAVVIREADLTADRLAEQPVQERGLVLQQALAVQGAAKVPV